MKVHMIGNAHLDPVWLWRWPEGYSEIISTCRCAVKMLNEYDGLIFTRGEAAMYKWIEKADPQLFNEITKLIKAGKWSIVNGWWIQPDCNIPNGESFVRQALYGKGYFKEKFGIEPKVGYCVDSFGHAGTLPQILAKSGYESYVFMRPGPHEKKLPTVFKWESPDGSQVNAFRISVAYTVHTAELTSQIDSCIADVADGQDATMCFYGVGNHGGGPTREQIENIIKEQNYNESTKLVFSSPEKYFEELKSFEDKLPVIKDELQYHSVGCYSADSEIKTLNRKCENSLQNTEKWATLANKIAGKEYPQEVLKSAWESLLFNQFHDILAGTSIKEAYDDARSELGGVLHSTSKISIEAFQRIMGKVDTDGEGIPFIVMNPSAFYRNEYVEFEPWLGHESWDSRIIVDSDENKIPYQEVAPSSAQRFTHRILFKAGVPALGYKVYWLKRVDSENVASSALISSDTELDSGMVKINLLPNGEFNIKRDGIEFFASGSNSLILVDDMSDTWSHGIPGYNRESTVLKPSSVKLIEKGNLRSTVKIEYEYNKSTVNQYISVYKDSPAIKTRFVSNWQEKHEILKLRFNFNKIENIIAEAPYGSVSRNGKGQEYPMQRALFIEDDNGGVLFANDSKYSYDVLDNELRLTLLRSTPYAWHDPYKLSDKRDYFYTDHGLNEFEYLIWPYSEERNEGWKLAQNINSKLEVLSAPKHSGKLPSEASFVELKGNGILLEALKEAEDGSGDVIFRFWETLGKNSEYDLHYFDFETSGSISPHEIVTLRFDGNSFKKVSLLEE